MSLHYNKLAGFSLERLAALSDGIFAVAMTLLVLDIHPPASELIHNNTELSKELLLLAPRLVMFLLGFMTLGIFWNGQQVLINLMAHGNRHFAWMQIAFLAAISLMPFSTSLLAQFITYKLALIYYWGNIVVPGSLLFASGRYAGYAGLFKENASREVLCALERRIVVAQTLYGCAMLLAFVNTYLSIACILLIQLNYALAPRIGFLEKI